MRRQSSALDHSASLPLHADPTLIDGDPAPVRLDNETDTGQCNAPAEGAPAIFGALPTEITQSKFPTQNPERWFGLLQPCSGCSLCKGSSPRPFHAV